MATKIGRTGTSSTNATKFTWSAWVKRADIGGDGMLFYNYLDGNNRAYLLFQSNDTMYYYDKDGGDLQAALTTTEVYRDSNAFYHICLIGDSTDSTTGDRIQLYVNGVRQTMTGTYPDVNDSLGMKVHTGTNYHVLGTNSDSTSNPFSGIMSHVHYVDGIDYPATTFGSTDSTTGEWKINTSPSITTSDYGNNGYFVLKDGNSVTDQSGNSHNFTVTAGTLTNSEDCPSNNFSTLLSNYQSNPTGGFVNAHTTAVANNDSTWRAAFSSIATPPSGKYYCELKWTSGSHLEWGAVSAPTTANNNFKDLTDSYTGEYIALYGANWYIRNANQSTYESGIQLTSGNIGMMAMDRDNNKFWWGLNGSWGGSQNPATNTGGVSLPGDLNEFWHFVISTYSNSGAGVYEFNFGNGYFGTTAISSEGTNASGIGKFEFDVPNGFTALSTKGLNE